MTTPKPVNKLKAALEGMAGTVAPLPTVTPTVASKSPAQPRPPSRRGKRNVSAYIDATAAKQLRLLAVELDRSTQSLLEEALNDLFRKHGKSALA